MKGCLFGGGYKDNGQVVREQLARLQWEVQYERSQRAHFQQAYHKELVRNGVLEHELATSAEAAKELKRSLMSFLGDEACEDGRGMEEEDHRPRKMSRRATASVASSIESDEFLDMRMDHGKENAPAAQLNRLAERLLDKASHLQNRLLSTSSTFTAAGARSSQSNSAATHTTFTSSDDGIEVASPARQNVSYHQPRQEPRSWQNR